MRKERVHSLIGILACCTMIASCGEKERTNLPENAQTPISTETAAPAATQAEVSAMPTATATAIATVVPSPKKTEKPNEEEHNSTPKPTETPEETISLANMEQMEEVLTNIACYLEEGGSYSESDEESYYEIMYMLANNVAHLYGNEIYKEENDEIRISQKAMQDLSAVAFAERRKIGTIPDEYKDMLMFDRDKKEYVVMASDAPQIKGEIRLEKDNKDGTYTVNVALIEEETNKELGCYEFILSEHKRISDEVPALFYYSINSVRCLS